MNASTKLASDWEYLAVDVTDDPTYRDTGTVWLQFQFAHKPEDGDPLSPLASLTPDEADKIGHALVEAAKQADPAINRLNDAVRRAAKQAKRPHYEAVLTPAEFDAIQRCDEDD